MNTQDFMNIQRTTELYNWPVSWYWFVNIDIKLCHLKIAIVKCIKMHWILKKCVKGFKNHVYFKNRKNSKYHATLSSVQAQSIWN